MDARKHTSEDSESKKKPYEKPTLTPLTREQAMRLLKQSAGKGNQDAERTLEQLRRFREGKKPAQS